ncbi:MAG: sigma-70 family RNA polymerase sigma factor [Armatimonadetes bacterium]|nr:sigma-70 family RNA polymerase sigma factor [Armatimonadota bacterium]
MLISPNVAPGVIEADPLRKLIDYRLTSAGVPAHDRDDLQQDILLSVLRQRAEFRPELGSIEAWIMGFVRIATKSYFRKQARLKRTELGQESLAETAAPAASDVEYAITEAVDHLTELDQAIVHMRFVMGMNSSQIGEELGIQADCVRKRLSRAVERMRQDEGIREALGFGPSI